MHSNIHVLTCHVRYQITGCAQFIQVSYQFYDLILSNMNDNEYIFHGLGVFFTSKILTHIFLYIGICNVPWEFQVNREALSGGKSVGQLVCKTSQIL